MASTQTIVKYAKEVGIGNVKVYKVVLDSGDTTFTLADDSWKDVYSVTLLPVTASTTANAIWDGTNVKVAGIGANDTVIVKVTGIYK